MLSAAELAARMAPKTQAWSWGAPRSDGMRVGAYEVAAMAAGMGRWPWELLRAVYLGDCSHLDEVERWLYLRTVDLALAGRWRGRGRPAGDNDWPDTHCRGDHFLRSLAGMALLEELHPGFYGSDQARAAALRVPPARWSATWRARYGQIRWVVGRELAEAELWMRSMTGDGLSNLG